MAHTTKTRTITTTATCTLVKYYGESIGYVAQFELKDGTTAEWQTKGDAGGHLYKNRNYTISARIKEEIWDTGHLILSHLQVIK